MLATQSYRVQMADVDAASVIYYASPLRWNEMLFTGWLASIGHRLRDLLDAGVGCPCVESAARYLRPIHLDDELELQLRGEGAGRSSARMRLTVTDAGGELAAEVTTRNVWVELARHGAMRSAPLPEWFRASFEPLAGVVRVAGATTPTTAVPAPPRAPAPLLGGA